MDLSQLQQYYRGFWIDAPVGNNAFSFDRRTNRRIYVPPLISGGEDDVLPGDEVAFCDLLPPGEGGGLEVKAKGLRNFVHLERPGQDIFIFDNHNHAFFFWCAAAAAGVISPGGALVHVDQHRDTREPDSWLLPEAKVTSQKAKEKECCPPGENDRVLGPVSFDFSLLPSVFDYTNHVLNVGNFIPPAIRLGLFREVIQVGSPEAFRADLPDRFVLDIDLDIFAPVMSYIPEDLKIRALRAWIRRAGLVTLATSPYFLDQDEAVGYVKKLLANP